MAISRMTDQIGRVVSGRYRVLAPVGTGASAEVFLAEDVRLKRRVAVKVLHAALADDDQFLRRFRAEAQAAAALNHPNIVAVYDWGEDDLPYIVTEYLGGGSLRSVLDTGARLTPSQALVVGLEAGRALDYAHRRGFVHRDIKPANLLFDIDRRLRVADFGLARALAEAAWTEPSGAVLGTARYASPEQAQGRAVDGKSDVYSLSLVLVEAVTGSVPFVTDTTIGTLMARIDTEPEIPEELGALRGPLRRAGAPDAADRPDAGELGVSLMAAAESLDRPEPIPLAPPDAGESTRLDRAPTADPTMLHGDVTAVGDAPDTDAAADDTAVADPTSTDADRPRRRWPVIAAIAVFAVIVGAAGAFALVQVRVPSHDVPPLVGLTVSEARAAVEEFGWRIETRETRRNGTAPDEVIDQQPEAGRSLDEGDTLTLVVSRGNELVDVPADLIGMTQEEAAAAVEAVGLEPVFEGRFDEEIDEGVILALGDGVGDQLPFDSEIALVISDGPEPRTVPDELIGLTFEEAEQALADVQLVAERKDVFSDDVEKGQVVGAEPPAGTDAARDSSVVVQVSKGPDLVAVPKVKGLSLDEAIDAIEEAGLEAGEVFGPARGKPDSTDPDQGTEVKRGTQVDIYLKR